MKNKFLKRVLDTAGGIENFSTMRVFNLPIDFKDEDLYSDPEKVVKISERKIKDTILVSQLEQKLA